MKSYLPLGGFLLLVAGAAALGGLFRPGPWFEALERPPLAPPNWIFGPVWTLLYLAMAFAAWRVWCSPAESRRALTLWGVQLGLNALWSPCFFGLERPGLALFVIGMLLVAIVLTVRAFRRIDGLAARLLWPYLAWVSFATYLNAGFAWLND